MKSQKTLIIAVVVFVLALSSWAAYALVIDKPSTNYLKSESVELASEQGDQTFYNDEGQKMLPCGGGVTGDHSGSVFDDVEKVNIIVVFTSSKYKTEEGQAQLPKPLQKKNIEQLYKDIYTERFTKLSELDNFKRYYPTNSIRCYNRNNQPVEVINVNSLTEIEKEIADELNNKNVLTVIVRILVYQGKHRNPKFDHDLVVVSTLNYRKYEDLNVLSNSVFSHAVSFPTNSSEELIMRNLEGYIRKNII